LGACRIGIARMLELLERFGPDRLNRGVEAMIEGSERMMRGVLADMPAGEWTSEDFLDDDGFRRGPIAIRVALRTDPRRRRAVVDFTGTDSQVAGNINAVYAITWSAVFYVFRCLLPAEAIVTAGLMRPVNVVAPAGTVVNATMPAAVAGGNVETSQRIVDAVLRALAAVRPERIPAASAGTMSNLTIGGIDPRNGLPYTYYETIAGGLGASPQSNGASGHHAHMTNSLNTPVEALEYAFPFRVVRYGLRTGSGGAGMHRGGDGIVREIELLAEAEATLLADRRTTQPWGLKGGRDGASGRSSVIENGTEQVLRGKTTRLLGAGARLCIESPGGGGWGRP
jgi:N-methylhydantoinase B